MNRTKRTQQRWIINLRTLMEARHFNPRSLSLKAGLNPTAVRDMLEGRTRFPRYDTVQALASTLGVTPAQLMGGKANSTEKVSHSADYDDNLDLLTEIIARLQEAAEDYKHPLVPRDFAAMVTAVYRQMKTSKTGKPARTTLKPRLSDLLEYESLRRPAKR
jgi:transcriptional regulator with XRE-family HTH domain